MRPSDTEIYHAWMKGESIGSIAKRNKMDKGQVRRIVNRVIVERNSEPPAMLELQDAEAGQERYLPEA